MTLSESSIQARWVLHLLADQGKPQAICSATFRGYDVMVPKHSAGVEPQVTVYSAELGTISIQPI